MHKNMIKTVSVTAASQSRVGWCPMVMKVQNKFQIHIMYQRYDGRITFYSNVDKKCQSKPNFGQVVDCEFVRDKNKSGEIQDYLQFRNHDNDLAKCNLNILRMFMKDTNQFTQSLAQLWTDGKLELLALYIKLLARSDGFGGHCEESHTKLGFKADEIGITETHIQEKGGNLTELLELIEAAKVHGFDFKKTNNPENGSETPNTEGRKRKVTDYFLVETKDKPGKMTKADVLVKDFDDECSDTDGVEKKLASGLVGKLDVKLSNLFPSPKIALPINRSKVRSIARSMKSRFDQTSCVLMICHADESNSDRDPDVNRYHVVHGVHRLLALKQIESEEPGGVSVLPGLENKKVSCILLNCSGSAIIHNYAQLRGNDISSSFQSKPKPHDLIFIYKSLIDDHCEQTEASVVLERYAKLLIVGKDEITSLKKICQWPRESLDKLAEVLLKYETYSTLDASGKGNKGRLGRGEKMPLPNILLNQIAKVDSTEFSSGAALIVKNEISLRNLLIELKEKSKLKDTKALACKEAKYKSFKDLQVEYPGKFSDSVMETFVGAESSSKQINLQGRRLTDYIKAVMNSQSYDSEVKFEIIESVVSFTSADLYKYNVVIFDMKSLVKDYFQALVDIVSSVRESLLSVLVLLPNGQDQHLLLSMLSGFAEGEGFRVIQVLFENSAKQADGICDNTGYSVLFGKFHVVDPPLMTLQDANVQNNLKRVVAQITPAGAEVAYVKDGKSPINHVHDLDGNKSCKYTYYGVATAISQLKTKLLKENLVSNPAEKDGENTKTSESSSEIGEDSNSEHAEDSLSKQRRDLSDIAKKSKSSVYDFEDDDSVEQITAEHINTAQRLAIRTKTSKWWKRPSMTKMAKFCTRITGSQNAEIGSSKEVDMLKTCENENFEEVGNAGDFTPSIDELLKRPECGDDGRTLDDTLDELDKEIAERQRKHEEEMSQIESNISSEKKNQEERKKRMKDNLLLRKKLEAEISESVLRDMFSRNKKYLEDISVGKIFSSRYTAFHKSTMTRHALYYNMITDPFTDSQLTWTLEEIGKVWMKNKREEMENNELVWKVLLPECFIKFYMDHFGFNKKEAEQRIGETPLRKADGDQDSSDEEL